jgi:hypothetical protein
MIHCLAPQQMSPYERGQAAARAGKPGPASAKPDTPWADRLFARGWSDEMDKITAAAKDPGTG